MSDQSNNRFSDFVSFPETTEPIFYITKLANSKLTEYITCATDSGGTLT